MKGHETMTIITETWARKQLWPSLDAINGALKCPRPLAGSGGFHWWYNDSDVIDAALDAGGEIGYSPIVCKTCGLKLKLSNDAPEFPSI